jgi:hypothetical protein
MQLRDHYLRKALEAEEAATTRRKNIKQQQTAEFADRITAQHEFWKDRNIEIEIAVRTDKACSVDPAYKNHISMNQWYTQYAIMFGIAANGDVLAVLLKRLGGPNV